MSPILEDKLKIFEAVRNQDYKSLVDYTCDISNLTFTDSFGSTLLHIACMKITENTLPIVQYLLLKGLDPNAVNENFKTPLDIAKSCDNNPALSLMKYYLTKG